ncbi:HET-domain-containing protein [Aaosphaeria arxii CBS 175.79]|uniref:HET-domain-containing protein n=1 Tax=Aaosphaeria arxii CBS 175.79 TaxID=1450172 RepID=A0A6A5XA84_9PLEO|nr:HET-domain-containing protein [Aaosphaeria arxii CBS 175.79]KAF2009888.1 HET-domain-containing protein [Aaosphaeria arxii CBS 175.79]
MRLLNVDTLEFEFFTDIRRIPDYVILSHTWGSEEVSYQEMCWLQRLRILSPDVKANPLFSTLLSISAGPQMPVAEEDIKRRKGYIKIVDTATLARSMGVQHIWVDTCCIDKTSSSELQEAINSMYAWYKRAFKCVVFLEDVHLHPSITSRNNTGDPDIQETRNFLDASILKARWFYRGWTLQELIAPKEVLFYDGNWHFIASKKHTLSHLSIATKIHQHVLATGDVSQCCVAQIMSWAARRQTTREEDMAYCLLGLFGIHMPMLYGEGSAAFLRLQLEILKTHPDDSIFAWFNDSADNYTYSGLLAPSPREFARSSQLWMGSPIACAESTSLGIQLTKKLKCSSKHPGLYVFRLNTTAQDGRPIRIMVRSLDSSEIAEDGVHQFARVDLSATMNISSFTTMQPTQQIYVRQKPIISSMFRTSDMHAFHLRPYRRVNEDAFTRIVQILPKDPWRRSSLYCIPMEGDATNRLIYVVVLKWYCPKPTGIPDTTKDACDCPFVYLGLGYDKKRMRSWCYLRNAWSDGPKFALLMNGENSTDSTLLLESLFPNLGQYNNSAKLIKSNCRNSSELTSIIVGISAALVENRISLIVSIEGLSVSP